MPSSERCRLCGKWTVKRKGEKHHLCGECNNERLNEYRVPVSPPPLSSPSPPPPVSSISPPPPLFPSHSAQHTPLSLLQRAAIAVLDKQNRTRTDIAEETGTSLPTVRHWIGHVKDTEDLSEEPRSGRPRMTDEALDTAIVGAAYVETFTSPRQLKRKYEFDPSARTIDRRLREGGLFGRVARHKKQLSREDKQKRLSFAEGYKTWTPDQWDTVLFCDEKKFHGAGFSGQIWVRRPKRQALNPQYCVDRLPHPVKLNVWGCFCGRGLGYLYIFNENMDAKLLKRILGTHLIESAQLHFEQDPPEQWWVLQDNDPKHMSVLVRTWLHNNGINMLDFPPYSPDLNPIEHLWQDMARRVEARPAGTIEELQDVVAEEWEATSLDFLRKLAHSMPDRCQAVIDAQGEHTKY
jgi:transposase